MITARKASIRVRVRVRVGTHALVQIRDAAARANAGAWLGPRTHPGGLGVPNARDAPCPKPAGCPVQLRTAGPSPSHRLRSVRSATREPGSAGRYWSMVQAHRVWWRPSAKGAHELHRLRMRLELRRHPWHSCTSLLGITNEQRDPPPSMEPVRHREGAQSRPQALGRHDEPQSPEPPPASACCWYV